MRLSVLEQSSLSEGSSATEAIANTVSLARVIDQLGYNRIWLSEHHSNDAIVGTAPEILMAAIAATTKRIRVGSAGVMLPHYAPFKVAEQFRVLEAIAPGRIDLGLGRAPGSDGRTAFALNPLANERPLRFPNDVQDLMAWLTGSALAAGHPRAGVTGVVVQRVPVVGHLLGAVRPGDRAQVAGARTARGGHLAGGRHRWPGARARPSARGRVPGVLDPEVYGAARAVGEHTAR